MSPAMQRLLRQDARETRNVGVTLFPKPAACRAARRALGTVQAHSNAVTRASLPEGSAVGIGQTPAYDGALPILRYAPGALTIHELPH